MRAIGKLPTAAATTIGDYLVTHGIDTEVEAGSAGLSTVWVAREDQLKNARGILERYLLAPDDPSWQAAASSAQRLREQANAEELRRAANLRTPASAWQGRHRASLTWTLIAISIVVTLIARFGDNAQVSSVLAIDPSPSHHHLFAAIGRGQVWRLLTPIFLHLNVLHLLFNMMWLFTLGSMIEMRQGRGYLALLVLLVGIGSNCGQYLHAGPAFAGMSGVISGLFGYIWIRSWLDPAIGYALSRNDVLLMMVWFFLCFSGILDAANGCHATGLAMGVLWGGLSAPRLRQRMFGK